MKKVAILYIALGRYTVFWDDFYKSCEEYLNPCEKHYFIWTDNPTPAMRGKNITTIPAQKKGWPYDSLLRFEMFLEREKELRNFDYIFFFNANFQFYNPVDLAEIAPCEWHDGLVAGLHPGRSGDLWRDVPDKFPYERRPESTACIPYGHGKHYVCGAFNGGTSAAFLKMCHELAKNIRTDLANDIVARVDDESHLNAYVSDKKYLLVGRAYGFPEGMIKKIPPRQRVMIKIISRAKDSPKYGGTQWLRGNTDKKMPTGFFAKCVRGTLHGISALIPIRSVRHKIRSLY